MVGSIVADSNSSPAERPRAPFVSFQRLSCRRPLVTSKPAARINVSHMDVRRIHLLAIHEHPQIAGTVRVTVMDDFDVHKHTPKQTAETDNRTRLQSHGAAARLPTTGASL